MTTRNRTIMIVARTLRDMEYRATGRKQHDYLSDADVAAAVDAVLADTSIRPVDRARRAVAVYCK